ncbi:MAG TPA: hypothetical protein P5561_00685 [Candidatus Omnitrophota bacterium]|nr:hypothetical protein [Candidatus Omnitrophota bacterium]HRY85028.1 hypothetical protein [Candidatus Omnitrophota bacterium]
MTQISVKIFYSAKKDTGALPKAYSLLERYAVGACSSLQPEAMIFIYKNEDLRTGSAVFKAT